MGKKYIPELRDYNFIYPDNNPYLYGVDIIHNINNNSVSGTYTDFSAQILNGNLFVTFNYTWNLNGAEPIIKNNNLIHLSVHMMTPDTTYFKPFRMVGFNQVTYTGQTSVTSLFSATITPSDFQVSSFVQGDYFFEIRFIGKRSIDPICQKYSIVPPSSTPTPTPTITPTKGLTPTPTPTITNTPSVTPTTSNGNVCTSTTWRIINTSGSSITWSGLDCSGNSVGGVVYNGQTYITGCVADGTFTHTGSPTISVAGYC